MYEQLATTGQKSFVADILRGRMLNDGNTLYLQCARHSAKGFQDECEENHQVLLEDRI